ncbi:MAG: glutathione S-transferase N-terminal domain-containing protein [Alphaproteobacteria bacterium]|nr:glutathione S-transferase N-terminal domain-containing protein [Alphaproteobacteria bacterium]
MSIDLYTWGTPNGRKVSIALEEMGLDYTCHPIDIMKDDQFDPAFLKISPNNKIPAIVDHDTGQTLMETGAILLYLAEKTGQFIPADKPGYWRCVEWLMWQMGGLGPMLGQAHHFVRFNPDVSEYATNRYATEAKRLYGVLDRRLSETSAFIAGADYTIADMAAWPWISRFEWQGVDLNAYPAVKRWYLEISARPAVQRGYDKPHYVSDIPVP